MKRVALIVCVCVWAVSAVSSEEEEDDESFIASLGSFAEGVGDMWRAYR